MEVFDWRGEGEESAPGLATAAVSEAGKPGTWAVLCHVFHFWRSKIITFLHTLS